MRVSSAAFFTLATLAVSNITQQANGASPQPTNSPAPTEENQDVVVVPFGESLPVKVAAVAKPETVFAIEFTPESPSLPKKLENNPPEPDSPVPEFPIATANTPVHTFTTTDDNLFIPVIDVHIVGASPELAQIIRKVIKTQVGGDTSQTQLRKDVTSILETGLFAQVRVNSVITKNGLNIVYEVKPVVIQSLQLSGANVLTYDVALANFQSQVGQEISPTALKQLVQNINKWYADHGYTLARVLEIKPNSTGILTIYVAEGLVSEIKFRFVNEENKVVDSHGHPIKGRTKAKFLSKQLKLKPGQVFQDQTVKQDIQSLYRLGLFKTVNVAFGGDAKKVDLIYELQETGARSVNLGGGYSADDGASISLTYKDQNVGGMNDTLTSTVGVNRSDVVFDTRFVSPYRASDPERLGYSINAFRHNDYSYTFDDKIRLTNGDRVRQRRLGGGFSLQQKVDNWDTSVGLNYTRTTISDRTGNITPRDSQGHPLSWSGNGVDDLTTVSFSATHDLRDNPLKTTHGSLLSFSTEQSIPIGEGEISLNRLRGNYSQYLPVQLFSSKQPQVFAVNLQAGTVIGDLPPYETFNLGGSNSIRGYDSGKVGSGRSFMLASAEYRFPIFPIAGGVFFADFGSDLGSGDTVLGNPAGVRGKPGNGFGYGAGIRLDSPLGLIRADYGINDQGNSRIHIGIGQKF